MRRRVVFAGICALTALSGCKKASPDDTSAGASPSAEPPAPPGSAQSPQAIPAAATQTTKRPDRERYAWLADDSRKGPKAHDTLSARFPAPPGYQRVAAEQGSFGAWLRDLPLAPPDTPVKNHKGEVVHPADDQYVAAVAAIDIGTIDLQQSPDVAVRLHAEWSWSSGARNMSYKGATGLDMPLSRWAKGQRLIASGATVYWAQQTKPMELEYGEFRKYLDGVFTWANSTSLAQQAGPVEPDDVQPGDFFLHSGSPGHALVILDIAEKGNRRVALYAQALNPTENVHVLRPGRATAWFSLRSGEPVVTPFTQEFSWDELRRLELPAESEEASE